MKRQSPIRWYVLLLIGLFAMILAFQFQKPGTLKKSNVKKPVSKYLTTNGNSLQLYGQPYTFTGVNVYSAASLDGVNAGCGGQVNDLDELFSSLRPNSIVRFWGWQGSMVTNVKTKQPDWSGIDRVLAVATKYKHRVIISLGDQSGTCDDELWKDRTWYTEGFMKVHNEKNSTPLSYWEFVQLVVTRYKDSKTIAMWELMNEPEAAECMAGYSGSNCYGRQLCPDHADAGKSLRYFFDTVGGKIKEIDPNHLIESGVIGSGQCGADNTYYEYIHQSPSIDVASYHDYNEPDSPMPGDTWNGLHERISQMKKINKPLIIGEAGMLAQDGSKECMSFNERSEKIKAKMEAQFKAGISGYIPWNWSGGNAGVCNYDIPKDDPLMTVLHEFPLLEVTPLPSPTISGRPTSYLIER